MHEIDQTTLAAAGIDAWSVAGAWIRAGRPVVRGAHAAA
jgi:hypothetical protein